MLSAWLHWKTSTSSCLVFPGLCCAVLCCSVVSLCDPMNCTPPGSSVQAPLVLQARILEWVAMPSSRVIFPTQGSNPGLLHCRQILYCLSHQRSPRILEWVAYPFSRGSSWPRNWTGISWFAGRFFTSWATREALDFLNFTLCPFLSCWFKFVCFCCNEP